MARRFFAGLAFLLPLWAWGQGNPPVPVEDFFRLPRLLQASLSPLGTQIAFTAHVGGKRIGLFTLDLARPDRLQRVAVYGDADIRQFRWVNEARLVYDVTDVSVGQGDQKFASGLFSVRPDGAGTRQLVKLDRPIVTEQRFVGREPLSYNHILLTVPGGEDSEDVIIGRYESDGHRSVREILPLRLNVDTGRVTSLASGAPDRVLEWLFDASGEPRIAITAQRDRAGIWWRPQGEQKWQQIDEVDALLGGRWWPRQLDASGRLYVTHNDSRGYAVLSRFNLARREIEGRPVVSTPGFDVSGDLIIDRKTDRVLGVRVITDAETTVWFDERLKAMQALADARHPGRVNRLTCRRCSSDDAVVLVRSFSDQDPGRYDVYFAKDKRWLSLGPTRPGIDPQRMATVDFHRTKARDGGDLPLWLTLPPGAKRGEPRPTVVMVHGGPWVRGGQWRWHSMEQFLASRGYVVVAPEFRGSRGYGTAHYRAGFKQWGRTMQDDVADALAWAVKEGYADAGKACIAGASYGGYATLMGLVRHPELYRCGVAWVAVTDPLLLMKWSFSSDMSDDSRDFSLPRLIGDPVADAEMLREVTPVHQAAKIKAPVLLGFGGEDNRVPIEHGTLMREALRKAGNDPTWIVYPTEGHGWRTFENQVDFARRVEAFLAQHLK